MGARAQAPPISSTRRREAARRHLPLFRRGARRAAHRPRDRRMRARHSPSRRPAARRDHRARRAAEAAKRHPPGDAHLPGAAHRGQRRARRARRAASRRRTRRWRRRPARGRDLPFAGRSSRQAIPCGALRPRRDAIAPPAGRACRRAPDISARRPAARSTPRRPRSPPIRARARPSCASPSAPRRPRVEFDEALASRARLPARCGREELAMMRLFNLLSILVLLGSAVYAYSIKYETSFRTEQIAKAKLEIKSEQDGINVLRAEWAFLTRPERVQKLSERYLDLEPLALAQIDSFASLPERPRTPTRSATSSTCWAWRSPARLPPTRPRRRRRRGARAAPPPKRRRPQDDDRVRKFSPAEREAAEPDSAARPNAARALLDEPRPERDAHAPRGVPLLRRSMRSFAAGSSISGSSRTRHSAARRGGCGRGGAARSSRPQRRGAGDRRKIMSVFAEPRRIIDKDEATEQLTAVLPDVDAKRAARRLGSRKGFVWVKREITPQQQQEDLPPRPARRRLPARRTSASIPTARSPRMCWASPISTTTASPASRNISTARAWPICTAPVSSSRRKICSRSRCRSICKRHPRRARRTRPGHRAIQGQGRRRRDHGRQHRRSRSPWPRCRTYDPNNPADALDPQPHQPADGRRL